MCNSWARVRKREGKTVSPFTYSRPAREKPASALGDTTWLVMGKEWYTLWFWQCSSLLAVCAGSYSSHFHLLRFGIEQGGSVIFSHLWGDWHELRASLATAESLAGSHDRQKTLWSLFNSAWLPSTLNRPCRAKSLSSLTYAVKANYFSC